MTKLSDYFRKIGRKGGKARTPEAIAARRENMRKANAARLAKLKRRKRRKGKR